VIIRQLVVHLLVTVQNSKRCTVQRIKIKKTPHIQYLLFHKSFIESFVINADYSKCKP